MHAVSSGLREEHRPTSPTLPTSLSVEEEPAEVIFQPQGAWDFPLSRTEKVRRLLLLFESEAEAHELEAAELRKENEYLKQLSSGSCPSQSPKSALRTTPSISAVTRSFLAASSEETDVKPRRQTCVIAPDEEDDKLHEATRSVSSPRHNFSPRGATSPERSGAWCPPAQPPPRRRRRTTIFHLPPETTGDGDAECSDPTVPMRARRRTAPPTAAALAAAQAAAENAYDAVTANCRSTREEVAAFGSPPCSPPESPRSDSGRQNRMPLQVDIHSRHHTSCIKAVQWSGKEAVKSMRFVMQSARSAVEESQERSDSEQFELLPGEYIQAIRGYAEVAERGIADWIDLVTSTNRSVTLGSQKHCGVVQPSFTCIADAGQEICGFTIGSNGCICDAQFCILDGFQ